jgi:DNA-binding transcriptional LysR family regulator
MTLPNLYHLKYFMDAVELGSVSASARKNLVSHPAISQAIKSLEVQMGMKLMDHQKKSFAVTAQGHALALKAKLLFQTLSHLSETPSLNDRDITGTVVLGMSRSIANAFLSPLLSRLHEQHPKLRLKVRFGTTNDMIERTIKGLIDLSITIGHQPMPTLKQSLLFEGQFVLIESVKKKSLTEKRKTKKSFILTKPQYETELLKKSYYLHFKEHLPLLIEVSSWDVISQLISDNLGIGLVPDISVTPDRRMKIKKLKADWFNCPYEIYLNEESRSKKSAAREVVIGHIRELMGKN